MINFYTIQYLELGNERQKIYFLHWKTKDRVR